MKRLIPIAVLLFFLAVPPATAQDPDDTAGVKQTCDELRTAEGKDRQNHIERLIKAGPKYLPIINKILLEEDEELERHIAELIEQLGHPEWVKRIEAQKELIYIGLRALPRVTSGKRNKDSEIAYRCSEIEKIIQQAKQDELVKRREQFTALITVVKAFADTSSLKCLHKLSSDGEKDLRRAAIDAIAFIADPSSLDVLFKALDDRDFRVECLAMSGLGKIKDTRVLELMTKVIEDTSKNLHMRRTAALSLKRNNHKKAIGKLINVLEDENYAMRHAAFKALRHLAETTETFGYEYGGGEDAVAKAARRAAVQKWMKWREQNRDKLPAPQPTPEPGPEAN